MGESVRERGKEVEDTTGLKREEERGHLTIMKFGAVVVFVFSL